jgi:hypothetical protein
MIWETCSLSPGWEMNERRGSGDTVGNYRLWISTRKNQHAIARDGQRDADPPHVDSDRQLPHVGDLLTWKRTGTTQHVGRLPDVCNGKDCTALKIGETCARHDHIICIDEDTTRCDIMLVTHELTVNDIDLSTREGYKRWHSLNKVFRQRSHWYQTVSHHNTSFTNEYNGVHVFLDVEVL